MKRQTVVVTKENEHEVPEEVLKFRDNILNWEAIRDSLRLCLMPKQEENKKNIAKKSFLDMDQYVRVVSDQYSCAVSENLIKVWGLDKDTVFETAKNNTEYVVYGISGFIKKMFDFDYDYDDDEDIIYVASTPSGFSGASAMCSNKTLDEIRSRLRADKIIILPCSIHEIIGLAYDNCDINPDEIREMIQFINCNELDEKEVLSNNAYIYDGQECMVM